LVLNISAEATPWPLGPVPASAARLHLPLHCIASIPTRPYSTAAIIGGTPRRSLPRYLNKRNEKRDPLWAAMTDAHPRFPVVVSFARARPVLPSAHKNLSTPVRPLPVVDPTLCFIFSLLFEASLPPMYYGAHFILGKKAGVEAFNLRYIH
jgi:hypothetical protein